MEIPLISKRQFNRFRKFLPSPGNAEKISAHVVISCAVWLVKNGLKWSQIPEKYGNYDTIRKRFSRWSKKGIFRQVFYSLAAKAGKSNVAMVDSTTVKAHRTSASLASDGHKRELGRSAGGLTSKIHLIANIEKMPIDFCLSPGQTSDTKIGAKLIERNLGRIKCLLADKAYDSNNIRSLLDGVGATACIPPKSNRKNPPDFDGALYRERSAIEIMFGRLKDWRGIAMRYCRNAHIFDSYVCVALIAIFFDVR